MGQQATTDHREKSLLEQIAIVLFIGLLMATLIRAVLRGENTALENAFQALAGQFTSQVLVIHSHWLMAKSSYVQLKIASSSEQGNTNIRQVYVNKYGWPDSKVASSYCEDIWQQVLEMPLEILKQKIVVLTVTNQALDGTHCRYMLTGSEYFDYLPRYGRVKYAN